MSERRENTEHNMPNPEAEKIDPTRLELRDVLLDRSSKGMAADSIDLESIEDFNLPEITDPNAIENVRLLKMLSGHRGSALRRLLSKPSPALEHIRNLYNWSGNAAVNPKPNLEALQAEVPEFLEGQTENEIYQRLNFAARYPKLDESKYDAELNAAVAKSLGYEGGAKWIKMSGQIFGDNASPEALARVLDSVGFIPREFTETEKFRNLPAIALTKTINRLVEIETVHREDALAGVARNERSRLLNTLLQSEEKVKELAGKKHPIRVRLDSNGLLINAQGVDSHLPFGLIEPATLEQLSKQTGIINLSESEIMEARVRASAQNNDYEMYRQLCEEQDQSFSKTFRLHGSSGEDLDRTFNEWMFMGSDIRVQDVLKAQAPLPDLLLKRMTKEPRDLATTVKFGEELSKNILELDAGHERRWSDYKSRWNVLDYQMLDKPEQTYRKREKILNDPRYYNVAKIAKAVLRTHPTSDPDNEFLIFRGRLGDQGRRQRHDFVQVVHQTETSRILIDRFKHLQQGEREILDTLPEYSPAGYEAVENSVQVFQNFKQNLNSASETARVWSSTRYFDFDDKLLESIKEGFLQKCENLLHFTLVHTGRQGTENLYEEALAKYNQLKNAPLNWPLEKEPMQELVGIFNKVKAAYQPFLYNNLATSGRFDQEFRSEISVSTQNFGEEYVKGASKNCVPWGWDKNLSLNASSIRIAQIDLKEQDPSAIIPFAQEEAALDAIHINRNRPLMVMIGGAQYMESINDDDPRSANSIAGQLVSLAHKRTANISVPGTQAGIGVAFGKVNVDYTRDHEHLPESERMHMFAITPAANLFFEGNKHVDPNEEVYGVTPVDTIATPNRAGWHITGNERLNSPYIRHARHSAAIFARASREQPRIAIVSNGGFYSMIDSMEAVRQGMPLVILNRTGRLAEAAACILTHGDKDFNNNNEIEWNKIRSILEGTMDKDTLQEFYAKDFGSKQDAENPNQSSFRELFIKFLATTRRLQQEEPSRIMIVEPEEVGQKVDHLIGNYPESWK